jgi:hypothetical protein
LAYLSPIPEAPPEIKAIFPFISKDMLSTSALIRVSAVFYTVKMNDVFVKIKSTNHQLIDRNHNVKCVNYVYVLYNLRR